MIELELPYPPSVNHYWRRVGARTLISRGGRLFRQQVVSILAARGVRPIDGDLEVFIELYPPDRRRRDVDITLNDSIDGYVHEKWGIFTDAFGNRLSFEGSMNESTTALMMNAENISTIMSWGGPSDSEPIEEMCESFEAMWSNSHPNFVVKPIPDAIRERLIKISEAMDLPVELDGKPAVVETKSHPLSTEEQQTLHLIASRTRFEDPALWEKIHKWLIEKDPQLEVVFTTWMEAEIWPTRRDDERRLMRVLFAISPLQRVMLRHTRSLLEQYRKYNLLTERLAKRTIRPIPRDLVFREDERAAYSELERYCADLQVTIGTHLSGQLRSSLGFYLSLLQQRFASSAVAIRNTMQRRLERVKDAIAALDRYGVDDTDQLEELRDTLNEDEWEGDEDELEQVIKATLRGRTRSDLEWEEKRLSELVPTYVALAHQRSTKTDLLLRAYPKT